MSSNSKKKEILKKKERKAEIKRETKETNVEMKINLDGSGVYDIKTSINFLNHMLELFSRHSGIDLQLKATGDLEHHLVEDIGIVLGQSILQALDDKKGIRRYGDKTLPMDEALAKCAIDLGGRGYYTLDLKFNKVKIEDVNAEDLVHFFESVSLNAKMNLHITVEYGENEHHKSEAAFKAFAHAFKEAIEVIGDKIPSTKGIL